jgi:hypothetical protein
MILAGRQHRAQGSVAPPAPSAHPLAAVLGDLLEATRSLAESVSVLVCCFFYPSIFLPIFCLQISWFYMLMPCYRQARRRRFGPLWRRRMILLPITLLGLRTPPHHSCRGCGAGRYVKSFHLFGWRVCLALPGCHLHVVHGVSTPMRKLRTAFFVHSENSIDYCGGVDSLPKTFLAHHEHVFAMLLIRYPHAQISRPD